MQFGTAGLQASRLIPKGPQNSWIPAHSSCQRHIRYTSGSLQPLLQEGRSRVASHAAYAASAAATPSSFAIVAFEAPVQLQLKLLDRQNSHTRAGLGSTSVRTFYHIQNSAHCASAGNGSSQLQQSPCDCCAPRSEQFQHSSAVQEFEDAQQQQQQQQQPYTPVQWLPQVLGQEMPANAIASHAAVCDAKDHHAVLHAAVSVAGSNGSEANSSNSSSLTAAQQQASNSNARDLPVMQDPKHCGVQHLTSLQPQLPGLAPLYNEQQREQPQQPRQHHQQVQAQRASTTLQASGAHVGQYQQHCQSLQRQQQVQQHSQGQSLQQHRQQTLQQRWHQQQRRQQISSQQRQQVQQQPLHWQHQARLQQWQASNQLAAQIQSASSWQAVRALLEEHETELAASHAVLLLRRLDKLLLIAPDKAVPSVRHEREEYVELVQLLLRMAGRGLEQLNQHELPNLVAGAARLPLVRIPKPWCVRVMTRTHHIMPSMTPTGIAIIVWGMAQLNMGFRPDFRDKLLQQLKEKMHEASPRALAVMVHGLAGVNERPDGLWMAVYLARVEAVLGRFNGRDLATCLWGLVQLRHAVHHSLLLAFMKRLLAVTQTSSDHEVSLAIWALGKLGHTWHSGSGGSSSTCSRWCSRSVSNRQSEQQVTSYGTGTGRFRSHSSAGSSNSASSNSDNGGSSSSSNQLAPAWSSGQYMGNLQWRLLGSLRPRLASMSAVHLVTLLYGLALQHSRPHKEWRNAALVAVMPNMQRLDGQGLCNLLLAVGMLDCKPDQEWQAAYWGALVAQVQRQLLQQPVSQQRQRQHQRAIVGPDVAPGVAGKQQAVPQQQGELSAKSFEVLHEAQALLGWQLPLAKLQGHLHYRQQYQRMPNLPQQHQQRQQQWQRHQQLVVQQQAAISRPSPAVEAAATTAEAGQKYAAGPMRHVQGEQQQQQLHDGQHSLHLQQDEVSASRRGNSSSSSAAGSGGGSGVQLPTQHLVMPPVCKPIAIPQIELQGLASA